MNLKHLNTFENFTVSELSKIGQRKLTSEYAKRVQKEINETKKLLDKELAYSEDLQNIKRIEVLKKHILKLENMLITKRW